MESTYGIKNPSNATLENVIHDEVENNNLFINLKGYPGNETEKENQAYYEIIKKERK